MKKRLTLTAMGFIAFLAIAVFLIYSQKSEAPRNDNGSVIVAVNEIEQLIISGDSALAAEKAEELKAGLETLPETK